jgi:cyanophycinase
MSKKAKGHLIIIGGHEDKEGDRVILQEVCRKASDGKGRLVIVTVATQLPEESANEYVSVFRDLGVKDLEVLDIRRREEAYDAERVQKMVGAQVVFFTGGDQLRITSQIGDSPVYRCMKEIFEAGGTIAGTSAGAAVMPATMLISGPSDESHEISALGMAPGLNLIDNVVVDTHFAERGRMGRLIGAVAQNPRNLGLGIDEDTAIVVEDGTSFRVIGSGAVYVVDGAGVSWSSLSEKNPEGILCIYDIKLHVLGSSATYDLIARQPVIPEGAEEMGG